MQSQKTEVQMTIEIKSVDGQKREYQLVGQVDMPVEQFAKLVEQEKNNDSNS